MIRKRNVFLCGLAIMLTSLTATGQTTKQAWVDSVFNTLNENEKIGQLIVVRISSHISERVVDDLEKMLDARMFGGVLFTTGTPRKQRIITNRLQHSAQVPLLIAQDGSSGLGHLLDSALAFPSPLAQAAIANDSMMYHIAFDIGKQLKAMGVQMSLGPNALVADAETVDISSLYGSDPTSVAKKSLLHIKGLQDAGVLSCAKFFPLKSVEVIDQKGKTAITLYEDSLLTQPFRPLIEQGVSALMPNITDLPLFFEPKRSDLKKKLSEATLEQFDKGELLHGAIGYRGIVLADLQMMEHSSDKLEPGDAGLLAFQAGADMLISDAEPEATFRKIKKALHAEKRYAAQLDMHVKKILALKYDAGLTEDPHVDANVAAANLQSVQSQVLRSKAYRESITVLRNENNTLPVRLLENKSFACVMVGDSTERSGIFHRVVKKYVPAMRYFIDEHVPSVDLSREDVIIVSLFPGTSKKSLQNLMGVLEELGAHQQVIVADFGSRIFAPYAARFPAVITGYSDEKDLAGLLPQVIFGAYAASGILPVAFGDIPAGTAIPTEDLERLAYSFPEDAGIDGETLQKISAIAKEAISSGSTPGCYVLVAKAGKVIYDHAFGHLTYEQQHPVTDETIYDLASLTKVAATLQAVMFMEEHQLIDVYKKLSVYLPELKGTNKKDITIIDALTHQSGLAPFVPLWPLTLEGPALKPIYYSSQQNISYPLQIAPRLFGSPILKDSVWSWITYSKMLDKPKRSPYPYRYSDLGFMMFKQLAERGLNQPLEDFLQQNFYEPLGAYSLGYTPLSRFSEAMIAPTELDTLFRGGLLIGTVHDERAAMLGGVSGHAGLFGTANDLSKLGQMLLQQGSYGGLRYYKPETVRRFTARQFASSRRGLGWDKPVQGEWNSPTSRYASPETFGHTGFTGTCLWVDPEFDLVYIFLSNRVFPARSDKLIQTNIRSRIQDVIYEAIFNFCKTNGSGF